MCTLALTFSLSSLIHSTCFIIFDNNYTTITLVERDRYLTSLIQYELLKPLSFLNSKRTALVFIRSHLARLCSSSEKPFLYLHYFPRKHRYKQRETPCIVSKLAVFQQHVVEEKREKLLENCETRKLVAPPPASPIYLLPTRFSLGSQQHYYLLLLHLLTWRESTHTYTY